MFQCDPHCCSKWCSLCTPYRLVFCHVQTPEQKMKNQKKNNDYDCCNNNNCFDNAFCYCLRAMVDQNERAEKWLLGAHFRSKRHGFMGLHKYFVWVCDGYPMVVDRSQVEKAQHIMSKLYTHTQFTAQISKWPPYWLISTINYPLVDGSLLSRPITMPSIYRHTHRHRQ